MITISKFPLHLDGDSGGDFDVALNASSQSMRAADGCKTVAGFQIYEVLPINTVKIHRLRVKQCKFPTFISKFWEKSHQSMRNQFGRI